MKNEEMHRPFEVRFTASSWRSAIRNSQGKYLKVSPGYRAERFAGYRVLSFDELTESKVLIHKADNSNEIITYCNCYQAFNRNLCSCVVVAVKYHYENCPFDLLSDDIPPFPI